MLAGRAFRCIAILPNREIGQECLIIMQGSNALSSRIFYVGIKHPKLAFLLSLEGLFAGMSQLHVNEDQG